MWALTLFELRQGVFGLLLLFLLFLIVVSSLVISAFLTIFSALLLVLALAAVVTSGLFSVAACSEWSAAGSDGDSYRAEYAISLTLFRLLSLAFLSAFFLGIYHQTHCQQTTAHSPIPARALIRRQTQPNDSPEDSSFCCSSASADWMVREA